MLPDVVPGIVTDEIPTLSVATTVNVTVWDCDEVVRATEVSSAEKLVIDGLALSAFVILTVISSVVLLPAASVTVAVNVSLELPKL